MAEVSSPLRGLPRDPPSSRSADVDVDVGSDPALRLVLDRLVETARAVTHAAHATIEVDGTGAPAGTVLAPNPELQAPRHVRVAVRSAGTLHGFLGLTKGAADPPFTSRDRAVLAGLASAAGYAIENARLLVRSERRRQWLEATMRIGEQLQVPTPNASAFEQLAAVTRTVTTASAVVVLQRNDRGQYLLAAADGPAAGRATELLEKYAHGISRSGSDVDLTCLPLDSADAVVLVPLRPQLATEGVLMLVVDRDRVPDSEEADLLSIFADHVCLALDAAQAAKSRVELELAADRERIARDLHGLVIDRLLSAGEQLRDLALPVVGGEDDDLGRRIQATVDSMDTTIKEIRATVFAREVDSGPALCAEVEALLAAYVPVLGFTPVFRTLGSVDGDVPAALGHHLIAVLRECLSNVARHAAATTTVVTVDSRADEVVLRVVDDGRGLPDTRHESGLHNVRRRAHQLGGTVWLHTSTPHGLTVEWKVPLTLRASA